MTMNFMDRALINLSMDSWFYDGVTAKTRNLGTLGGTVQLGDGTTVGTFPTQVFPHGMSFDGGDYLICPNVASLSFTAGGGVDLPFSLECVCAPGGASEALIAKGAAGVSSEYRFTITANILIVTALDVNQVAYIGRWSAVGTPGRSPVVNHYVATYDGSKTAAGFALYGGGARIDTNDYVNGVYTGMAALGRAARLGWAEGTLAGLGTYYNFAIYPFALQPGEVAQLAAMRRAMINRGY